MSARREPAWRGTLGVGLLMLLSAASCRGAMGVEDLSQDTLLTATVVLRPADGRDMTGLETITSENVQEFMPDPGLAERVMAFFRTAGFEVHPGFGPMFTIVGSRKLFEDFFEEEMVVETQAGQVSSLTTSSGGLELSRERLPEELAGAVISVAFEPPPDFGPPSF